MSDRRLRELERQASTGDLTALSALDAATCRTSGHQWQELHTVGKKWFDVEVCTECLFIKGSRVDALSTPDIFVFTSRTVFYKIGYGAGHIAASIKTHKGINTYLDSITSACSREIEDLPTATDLLSRAASTTTCKQCIAKLNKMSITERKQLKETSSELFRLLHDRVFNTKRAKLKRKKMRKNK